MSGGGGGDWRKGDFHQANYALLNLVHGKEDRKILSWRNLLYLLIILGMLGLVVLGWFVIGNIVN